MSSASNPRRWAVAARRTGRPGFRDEYQPASDMSRAKRRDRVADFRERELLDAQANFAGRVEGHQLSQFVVGTDATAGRDTPSTGYWLEWAQALYDESTGDLSGGYERLEE